MVAQTCPICEAAADKCCAGCHEVYYCSKDHQKQDWIRHKLRCKPFKVAEDAVVGRHLVTTRDVTAGEVVLREPPLIQGPAQVTGPVCLSCLQAVSQHNSEPCERCGWPLCLKPDCRQSRQHRPECQWTVDKRKAPVKISQFATPHPSYEIITALRLCYARRHQPELWTRLSRLEAHASRRRDTAKYREDLRSIAQFLRRFYKLEEEFSDEEIMDMWGIIQVNGHEVPITHPAHVAVYDTASMLEHSCHPNCSKSFTSEGWLVVRAARSVPRGQHLTICYTDCLWGTVARYYHLLDTKFFSCCCVRCSDNTELGTYFSALLCQNTGCGGPVLPASLRGLSPDTPWTCGRCGHTTPGEDAGLLLHRAGEELTTLSGQGVTASLRYLDRWRDHFHPNHYYLTEVRLTVAQWLGQDCGRGVQDLSDNLLALKADLCRQLIELIAVIGPAEMRVRGTLMFEVHACLAEKARRIHLQGDGDAGGIHTALLESKRSLESAIYLLQEEPEVLPEGKLLVQARRNLLELDKSLQKAMTLAGAIPSM